MEKYLKTAGLTIEDVELVNIAAGDAATVLSMNQADAVAIWEPTVTRLSDSGSVRILGEGPDCGLAGTNAIVCRTSFARNNPEIVTAILTQYKRAADALADPSSLKDDTLKNVAAYLSVEEAQLGTILEKFSYTVEISQEDIFALNDTIDFLNRNRILKVSYDISESTDGSYYKRR